MQFPDEHIRLAVVKHWLVEVQPLPIDNWLSNIKKSNQIIIFILFRFNNNSIIPQ